MQFWIFDNTSTATTLCFRNSPGPSSSVPSWYSCPQGHANHFQYCALSGSPPTCASSISVAYGSCRLETSVLELSRCCCAADKLLHAMLHRNQLHCNLFHEELYRTYSESLEPTRNRLLQHYHSETDNIAETMVAGSRRLAPENPPGSQLAVHGDQDP